VTAIRLFSSEKVKEDSPLPAHFRGLRNRRRTILRLAVPIFIILALCSPAGLIPSESAGQMDLPWVQNPTNQYGTAQGELGYSSSGAAQPFTLQGVLTNETQDIVLLDSSNPSTVSLSAPQGWTATDLSGSIDHLTTQIDPVSNGPLDAYHTERYIIGGSAWNSETYDVPDGWTLAKAGDSTPHPKHGGLYWYNSAGLGRDATMGWRPSVLFSTSNTLSPSMEIYLAQELQMPWREVYSCRVSFYHYVPTGQTLTGYFQLFVKVGNYVAKFDVLSSGYTTGEWIEQTVDIPHSAFEDIPVPGSAAIQIGLSTDYSGQPAVSINNYVYIDEISVMFEARPFPEQIGLSANQSMVVGSVQGSTSPYVPDGAYRDCYDHPTSGIASTNLDVGVKGTSWTGATKYQIGIQFPLSIPSGAVITSAYLEVEAASAVGGGNNGLRIYVAQEDTMTAFSSGLPHLEDRYSWSETSIDWVLDEWVASNRYRSPDIASLIQGAVAMSGWSSGNYVGIMLDYMFSDNYNDYNRMKGTASYNGADLARLFVEYLIPEVEDTITVFSYSKSLTIDHTKVSADLQNFPVLVDIFDADLKSKAQPDGDDIRFRIGTEQLDHQIELYDPDYNETHAHLVAWVRVPHLSSTSDTTLSMYYGVPDAGNAENANGVWMSRYENIWHMSESSGSGAYILDSSQQHHDATPTGALFMDDGMIDGARYLQNTGTSNIACEGAQDIFNGWSDWQFSIWMYPDFDSLSEWQAGSSEPDVFYKGASMMLARVYSYGGSDGTFQIDMHFAGGGTSYLTVTIRNKAWNYVTMKYESTGDGRLRAYSFVDGSLYDSYEELIGTGDNLQTDSSSFYLGSQNPGTAFCGGMDEFRTISSGYTSFDWIETEYANQYDPSSFYALSDEQTPQFGGDSAELQFTTTAQSTVRMLPRLRVKATHQGSTLDENLMQGTSFSVSNNSAVIWTANVLVSPPSGVSQLNLTLEKPSTWTLTDVTDSIGRSRISETVFTGTQVMVDPSVLDVLGVWAFTFSSANEVSSLECGADAGAYAESVVLDAGNLAKFRATGPILPGSAARLHLIDPSGSIFYAMDDLTQDGVGQFEWTGISVASSWPNGVWQVRVDFNETADASPERAGTYSRFFIVRHASALQLVSPTDAVGDGVSSGVGGDFLTVEVQLTDTATSLVTSGSTITMNWSISGMETLLELEDYGTGVYGRTVNTSDLGEPGSWRINIQSSHPYLSSAMTYFDLELSHTTVLTYETPAATAYGDDFSILVSLRGATTGTGYAGASFGSNGTISGVTDYGDGTYLIEIDSTGFDFGVHTFTLSATPTQDYVIGCAVEISVRYREIETDLVQTGINPVAVPWGQEADVVLVWLDLDHGGTGIGGGALTGDASFTYSDVLDGNYTLEIDVSSYNPGTYLFNFTITLLNHQTGRITVAVSVQPHRTLVVAQWPSSVPLGANASVTLTFVDLDAGNSVIIDNISSVLVQWPGGSSVHGALLLMVNSQDWNIGSYMVRITVQADSLPRYFYDAQTTIVLNVRRLQVTLTCDEIGVVPMGDDLEITTQVVVNDSSSIYHQSYVDGLDQSHFEVRAADGTLYDLEAFSALGSGSYLLTLDQALFSEGLHAIRIYVIFSLLENYTSTQTPATTFEYAVARSDLTSPDYPLTVISYSSYAVVTLEFVDLDRGVGIDTAIIYVSGAEKLYQQWISSGRYRITLNTSTWAIGVYSVNFTATAPDYESKAIFIDIQIRQIRTYATATAGILTIPIGDSQSFYVDYIDMDHDVPIYTTNHECNWSAIHYDIIWQVTRYKITIHTFETDGLGQVVLDFSFSVGSEYQNASFMVQVVIRSVSTELRLVAPVEDATPVENISISVYYGDRDHSVGIASSFVSCTVMNSTHALSFYWSNGTADGFYEIRVDASQFGGLGLQQITVYFSWTGGVQKFEDKQISFAVEILGEETELTLTEAAAPSPCLEYVTYTFLYSSASSGEGVTNDTGNVYIGVRFEGVDVDLSQVSIWEVDSIGSPGEYSIGFNNSILGGTGYFSMTITINWSAGVSPYYSNRADSITVRVLPRSALLSIIPPTSVPFGENATFSFTYEDTTGGSSSPIAYSPAVMTIALSVPDFSLYYDALEGLYTISFNTSQLGAPIGLRTFTLDATWAGLPFYTNTTGRVVSVTLSERQTILTYPTLQETAYGDNITFTVVFLDVGGTISKEVQGAEIEVYHGPTEIPTSYLSVMALGSGEYQIRLNTSYFGNPGQYALSVFASSTEFYYQDRSNTRMLTVSYRHTLLTAEPPGDVPYGTSFSFVLHYQDIDTSVAIGNNTQLTTHLQILNGTDWIVTCVWRPTLQNYLVTIQTQNQILAIGVRHTLYLNLSAENKAPFYEWSVAGVRFTMVERDTRIDLISAPLQTRYQDDVSFTILYKDVLSSSGISGGTINLYYGGSLLQVSVDYDIAVIGLGLYRISLDTSVLGAPGAKMVVVTANWTGGAPYYENCQRTVSFTVTSRPTSVEILAGPSPTWFLENVTFDFAFIDLSTGTRIAISPSDVQLLSGATPLSAGQYTITPVGLILRISINSTVISGSLVSNWEISVQVHWPGGAPYYYDSHALVHATTTQRIGTADVQQIVDTAFGDMMNLSIMYSDLGLGTPIEGATVVLDCIEAPGLVEGVDYWIQAGTGAESGIYRALISTASLGSLGTFHFEIQILWDDAQSPYYSDLTTLQASGVVREIQTILAGSIPTPSVIAFYQNLSFIVEFTDTDHGAAIDGAENYITLRYLSNGAEPSCWSVSALSGGLYSITLNASDSLAVGLQSVVVSIDISSYEQAETQVVFGLRNRITGLSASLVPTNYAGYPTYVILYVTDYDASDSPLSGATLVLTWGDGCSYIDLGDGRYNITLQTANLDFGSHVLRVEAHRLHYGTSGLDIEIDLLAVPSELVVTWTGPRGTADAYWGEAITIYATMNDTLRNQAVSTASITFTWLGGTGSFIPTGTPGNYSALLDTSQAAASDTITVTIVGASPNCINASYLLTFRLIPRPMDLIPNDSRYVYTVAWGGSVQIIVYLEDSLDNTKVTDASLSAEWNFASGLNLTEMAGQPGYYTFVLAAGTAGFDSYEVQIDASKENYGDASVTLILSVSQIDMVMWLDNTTAAYEYTPVYWSEVARIGVYVLAPDLNPSYPYATGISGLVVTWVSPELGLNGTLLDGSLIGGAGYYYYDFNTSWSIAAVHTFRLKATPPSSDYTDAENSTSLLVRNLEAVLISPGSPELVWGWAGLLNFTYFDLYHTEGVEADSASYSWAGGGGGALYLGHGEYGIPIDASRLMPGTYTISISCRKANYNDVRITIRVHISPVPTEAVLRVSDIYWIAGSQVNLQVPYGDSLEVIVLYNDTYNSRGIPLAVLAGTHFSGPGFYEQPLVLSDLGAGNYSFQFDTTEWILYSRLTFHVQLALENHTTGLLTFDITVIEVPAIAHIQGSSDRAMYWGTNATFWITYTDAWSGHSGEGITDSIVVVENDSPHLVVVELVGEDPTRPGWYQFVARAHSQSGVAHISIAFNSTYYTSQIVALSISISPSPDQVALMNAVTYGGGFIIIIALASLVWVRIIRVPKIIRAISGQIRRIRRGRVPKPAKSVKTRQALVADIFNEIHEPLGIKRKIASMPPEPIVVEVPEIEELIVDLAILTEMSQEELDDFRLEISKMKMSQQTSFVREVIAQELVRVATVQGKSVQQVLEEVVAERRRRIGGEALLAKAEDYVPAEEAEAAETTEEEPIFEDRLREVELEEMASELEKRGIPKHEIESFVMQAKDLPKDIVEMLLQSFKPERKAEAPKEEVEHLTESELENLRSELKKKKISDGEIDSIMEQARDLPKDLALELLKEREEKPKRKRKKKAETLSEAEREELRAELVRKGVPEEEIESIMRGAKTAPKETVSEFLESIEEVVPPPPEDDIEFEDMLSEFEIENLRKQLQDRGLPPEEVESIVKQARGLPSALIDDLLKSIDADRERE
jgi:hypothetical protein